MILVLEFALQWWADIPSTVNYFKMSEYDEKKPIISTEDNINTEEIVVSVPLNCFGTQYYNSYGPSMIHVAIVCIWRAGLVVPNGT